MQVLEVRNAELIGSLIRQAAEHGISDAAIVALIGAAYSFTVSTRGRRPHRAHHHPATPASRDDRHRRDHRRQGPAATRPA